MSSSGPSQHISSLQRQAVENARSAFLRLPNGDALFQQSIAQADTVPEIMKMATQNYHLFKNKRTTQVLQKLQQNTLWLQNFSGVVDVVVQTQAGIGCPLWAPLKFVLQISKYHTLVVEQIVTMIQTISDSLPRFQIYEKLHPDPILQTALLNVFTDVVEFSLRASLYFRGSALTRLGRIVATSMREELGEIIDRLKTHAKIVDHTAVAAELIRAATFRSALAHEGSEMASRDYQDLRLKFENWLNPPNIKEVYESQIRKKLHGTCQWIWTHPTFLRWDNPSATSTSDRLLYIYGTHGCGKTILAASIVEILKSRSGRVLFFSFAAISWAIDGVDECGESTWPLFERIHNQLASHKAARALLLGRPHLLPEFSTMGVTIEIIPYMTRTDMEVFIEDAVTSSEVLSQPELHEHVVTNLQEKADGMFLWAKLMIDDLRKSSSRSEIMERLRNLPRGLQDAYRLLLARLVHRLDNFELRLARCILSLTIVSRRPLRLEELQYAQALDIRSTLAPSAQLSLHNYLLIEPTQKILRVCGGLINITDGIVRLIHLSIKEFLTRPEEEWSSDDDYAIKKLRVKISESHDSFSSICLDYLELGGYDFPLQDPQIFPLLETRYPFLDYASRFMIHHCNESVVSSTTAITKLSRFLTMETCVSWLEYFAIILIDDGSNGSLMQDLGTLLVWLERDGHAKEFLLRLQGRVKEELSNRQQKYGPSDWRTDQWRTIFDLIEDEGTGDSLPRPEETVDPAFNDSSIETRELIRLLNGTGRLSMHGQVNFFLKLQRQLQRAKALTDPLKVLFRLILQK
ncbi:hypothetical protein K469DRAFT_748014 [Zopfia rhizophila CBS 207.26]|uniref:NACHT domain-containing protein n=1 Tax=Zopfia rhizophila CBS 207.26 TaxID=1314779 RepID=A0A6A6EE65_9PEZI|nr:hypothetical protein K469DRAFT_748014 [Zopfia rhizophila CBS 207.26]